MLLERKVRVTDHLREYIAIELSPNFKVTLLRDVTVFICPQLHWMKSQLASPYLFLSTTFFSCMGC